MKKGFAIILLVQMLAGCNQVKDIKIVNNNSVFSPGETIVLELYAPINHEIMPSFFLIDGLDTLALPFDFEKKCAFYRATHNIERKHRYRGYVIYATTDREIKKSLFEIRYKIKR